MVTHKKRNKGRRRCNSKPKSLSQWEVAQVFMHLAMHGNSVTGQKKFSKPGDPKTNSTVRELERFYAKLKLNENGLHVADNLVYQLLLPLYMRTKQQVENQSTDVGNMHLIVPYEKDGDNTKSVTYLMLVVVDAMARSDATTLSAAIEAAKDVLDESCAVVLKSFFASDTEDPPLIDWKVCFQTALARRFGVEDGTNSTPATTTVASKTTVEGEGSTTSDEAPFTSNQFRLLQFGINESKKVTDEAIAKTNEEVQKTNKAVQNLEKSVNASLEKINKVIQNLSTKVGDVSKKVGDVSTEVDQLKKDMSTVMTVLSKDTTLGRRLREVEKEAHQQRDEDEDDCKAVNDGDANKENEDPRNDDEVDQLATEAKGWGSLLT